MQPTTRKSAADIVIRKKAPSPPLSADDALFTNLRALMAISGPNRHDQATVVILACIDEGIDTVSRIMGVLRQLGFNPRHAGMTLNKGTGYDPERHRWSCDGEGRYSRFG